MGAIFSPYALTVFLAIGRSAALSTLSVVFGEVFEHLELGHVDHDLGDGGPGYFSLRVLSVFVTAFGGGGRSAFRAGSGLREPAPRPGGGVALAGVVYYFARLLYASRLRAW